MPYFRIIEKFVPDTGRILDYGCGHGFFCNYMKFKSPNREIIGIDLDKEKIAIAKKTIRQRAGITFIPLTEFSLNKFDKFEAVVIIDVLPYLKYYDSGELLKSIAKKTDLIIIKDHDTIPKWRFAAVQIQEYFATNIAKYTSTTSPKLCFRSSLQITELMNNLGFKTKVIRLRNIFPYPDILYICEKK